MFKSRDFNTIFNTIYFTIVWVWVVLKSKIEKVPMGIQGEKSSKDTKSSGNLVSTIGA